MTGSCRWRRDPRSSGSLILAEDPTEQSNLAAARPDKVAELMALLDAHAANARAPLYRAEIEAPVVIDKDLSLPFEPGDEWVSVPN